MAVLADFYGIATVVTKNDYLRSVPVIGRTTRESNTEHATGLPGTAGICVLCL